ncbi:hypothetical protein [Nocardia africana]|uniref:MarR family n=1 Tax=Nocardia africana TaxID=134964 RepID=A0ABW6NU45_9NOCA
MSTRKKTTRATTRPATGATATTGSPADEPVSAGGPVLGTDAETVLWAVLSDYPGANAAELAVAAGMAGSTARRILSRWAASGVARRDRDPDHPRAADRWSAIADSSDTTGTGGSDRSTPTATDGPYRAESGPAGGDTAVVASNNGVGGADPAQAQQESSVRLAPGALRGQVEDFLRDHPEGEFSPHEIGKALARSSGAVHNALAKLTTVGTARRTSDRPKKFALATS